MLPLAFVTYISCSQESDTAEPAVVGWSHAFESYSEGAFMAIWEASTEEHWVVGGQESDGFVLRGKLSQWTDVELPAGTPLLNWVHGTGPNHVWVGGLNGTILRWDGTSWTDYSVEMEEAIWGIYALDEQSVVAVGGESRWGGEVGKILSFDGEQFVELPLPEPLSGVSNLFKVSHLDDQYWIVGAGGALLKGDEAGFEAVGTGIATDLITIVNAETSLHVVGGRGTGVYFAIQDGDMQDVVQLPAGINGVDNTTNGTLLVGERGYSAEYKDGELLEYAPVTFDVLHAALVSSEGDRYAVGGNLFTSEAFFHGTLLYMEAE